MEKAQSSVFDPLGNGKEVWISSEEFSSWGVMVEWSHVMEGFVADEEDL